jgi:hypothetical protein
MPFNKLKFEKKIKKLNFIFSFKRKPEKEDDEQ